MGYIGALGMAEHAPLGVALHWHLTSNHYPPHPEFMVPVAERAVRLAHAGEWERPVLLPAGVEYRRAVRTKSGKIRTTKTGRQYARVSDIVESMHLEAFIHVLGAADDDCRGGDGGGIVSAGDLNLNLRTVRGADAPGTGTGGVR